MIKRLRPLLALTYAAWLAAWFWIFSFGFTTSYFTYHLGSRIPVLLLALLAIAVPPFSCAWTIRRALNGTLGPIRAILLNLALSGAPLLLFLGVLATWIKLVRLAGGIAFEGDEALGHGIVFLVCGAVVLAAILIVPLLLGAVALRRHRRRDAA